MLSSISKLANTGVLPEYDELHRLRIRLFNFDLLLGIGLPLIALSITVGAGVADLSSYITIFFFVGLCAFTLYLNSRHFHDIAALLFLSFCIAGIMVASLVFGKEAQVHFYLLSISASSFIYQISNRVTAWFFFVLQLLCFLFLYYWPSNPLFEWSPERIRIVAQSNITIAILFFG
ncbi:MAG: hypothetical protein F6K19_25375, partial [Cyanothece sp. SIO1E1]|nr:hypothetical protein [Cyanothece sp. SIO1E1]